jgi:hypothetical protein
MDIYAGEKPIPELIVEIERLLQELKEAVAKLDENARFAPLQEALRRGDITDEQYEAQAREILRQPAAQGINRLQELTDQVG